MTALLTEHLPLLAGAPNGVKKLRELILELAVRGKLVPQALDDEPVDKLFKRIAMEKSKAEAEGRIRKQKTLPNVSEDERPFELPPGWMWTRLGDLAFPQAGFAFKSSGFNQAGLGLPLIRIRDVGQTFSGTSYEGDYRSEFLVAKGDYLVSMDGEFRVAAWLGDVALLNQRVSRLIFFSSEIASRFIAEALQVRLLELQGIKAYTTVDHLSGGQISEAVVALPPLREQHRIVAKIDELMVLCDALEAQQADAESAHTRLVQALLDSLTQATDTEDFAASWHRLSGHFDTLFTTEASIEALEQTVLQLAVMGKLVPQKPADESTSDLVREIEEARSNGGKRGRARATAASPSIGRDEIPFDVPPTWKWVRLGDMAEFINGDRGKNYPNKAEYVSTGVPWINTGHIEPGGSLTQREMNFITREKFDQLNGGKIRLGDLVYCLRGATFGKTAIVDPYEEGAIASSLMIIRPFPPCSNRYMYRYLTSRTGRSQIFRFDNGSAQPNLSADSVRLYVYPLAPLAEQHRIVAKVDELMVLCDQLKSRIRQARDLNQQLAKTLVEHAVT